MEDMSIVVNSRPDAYTTADVDLADAFPNIGRSEHLSHLRATAGKPAGRNESGSPGSSSGRPVSPASLPDLTMPDAHSELGFGPTSSTVRVRTFEHAILPHLDAAYNLARWLTGDPVVAEDIVQDACVRALQYFDSFRGENGRAWLLRIVRNAAYARLRSQRAGVEVVLGGADKEGREGEDGGFGMEVPDPDPGPEAALAITEDLARLKAAMAALPIDLRQCLVLRDMEELSYKQIAEIVDVPIGTVMSRLCRARRMLMAPRTTPSS
jgi:RNA polymerase sigma factor (sigma-70 family)